MSKLNTIHPNSLRIAFSLVLLLLCSIAGVGALRNGGGGNWQHSCEINIINPGTGISNYQVFLPPSGMSFLAGTAANGANFRFFAQRERA